MKQDNNTAIYASNLSISEENRVPGFDPMRFLKITSNGPRLDLGAKKVWFRLKYPQGRIALSSINVTEQMALIEARVYLSKTDTAPSFTSKVQKMFSEVPGGMYIQAAQHAAVDQALDEAGFTVHIGNTNASENTVKAPVTKPVSSEETAPAIEKRQSSEEAVTIKEVPQTIVIEEKSEIAQPKAETMSEPQRIEAKIEETEITAPTVEAPAPIKEENAETNNVSYTTSTPVDEICAVMTVSEAMEYIIPTGCCQGWTIAQALARRPASVKFYLTPGYKGDDNILRASAKIALAEQEKQNQG